jgi:uncharacterized protein (DUF983 family)
MAEFDTMLDRVHRAHLRERSQREQQSDQLTTTGPEWHLPEKAIEAAWRAIQGRCPSCGETPLFTSYLRPIDSCHLCSQDWTPQQADDFPAYVAIILTGHIMAPIIIALVSRSMLPMWANVAVIISLALILLGAILQPAKGAIIAFQWWMGMHGFERPKRIIDEESA